MDEYRQMLVLLALLQHNLGDAEDLIREMSDEARAELLQAANDIQALIKSIK